MRTIIAAAVAVFVIIGINQDRSSLLAQPVCSAPAAGETVPLASARVVQTFPHDTRAYTQGLTIADGQLYEGTGWLGESNLRRVDMTSGSVLQQTDLPGNVFGEGIAVVGNRIVQLSWRNQTGYVYNRETFALLGTFSYPSEGWGLTYDGSRLILSDGTDILRFLDPETFAEIGQVRVSAAGRPVFQLNELEYINGAVYANVWQTDRIAIIDPTSGNVCSWIDLNGLNAAPSSSRDDVLNGVAYDADTGRVFVTGKRWPTLFEIEVSAPAGPLANPE
jgi:glutaminyl-peptide cyclotransferase